jgi:hypothetical protein
MSDDLERGVPPDVSTVPPAVPPPEPHQDPADVRFAAGDPKGGGSRGAGRDADRQPTAADLSPAVEPSAPTEPSPGDEPTAAGPKRPMVERIGMAAIAAVMATLFAAVSAISLASGEPFLGIMAAIGVLMTGWVGLQTLLRG